MTMHIADQYAFLKNQIDSLTKELDKVKAQIKATGCEEIVGDQAVVTVGLSERSSFDAKVAKTFLTDEQIETCTKVSLVETLRIKPLIRLAA